MKIHKRGSTAMMLRIFGDRMNPCYDNKTGEHFKFFEITQEVLKMDFNCMVEEQAPEDKDGMAEATFVDVGDYIVITNKGVRRLSSKDFQEKYSF